MNAAPQPLPLGVRDMGSCRYDLIALGEVMLRLDPGEGRIHTARKCDVSEGGGEYNVARGLRRCFGQRTGIVTALVDNKIGRLVEDLILQGGVDTSLIKWVPNDGIGHDARNGLNFTERGFGVRGAMGVSDRGHTAASQMAPQDVDWDDLFGRLGTRWLHTGGIFAALSKSAAETVLAAVRAARSHGTIVSYDLNYRPSLWARHGGKLAAQKINRTIAGQVDVLFGNEEDFAACLGMGTGSNEGDLDKLDHAKYERMIEEAAETYTNIQVIATTLRTVRTATVNDWDAIAWARGPGYAKATPRLGLEILDRVGGGDSFAAGLIYGLLQDMDLPGALDYGTAHGALAMTTPGDTSMATLAEVTRLVEGGGARVQR